MAKDPVNTFLKGCVVVVIIFLAAVMIIGTCSCKLIREVKKSSSDSTSVKKDETEYTKVDTSKSTKEKDSDRITFVYPIDTTVNNYYTYPSTVIYEKIKEKEESKNFDHESFKREILDSVGKRSEVKEVESKTKIGPSLIEWVLIGAV